MSMKKTKLLDAVWLLFGFLIGTETAYGASFYGDSYIQIDADRGHFGGPTTEVSFQFRTRRSNGLLLATVGRQDYLIIEVKSSEIEVQLDLGEGQPTVVRSAPGTTVNDLQWHHLKLLRDRFQVTLTLDYIHKTSASIQGVLVSLDVYSGIFLGKYTNEEFSIGRHHGFRGCLKDVMYNQQDLFYLAKSGTKSINNHEVSWDCSEEFDADINQEISLLDNTSFIALPHILSAPSINIEFDIKTRTTDGILLYNSGHSLSSNYIAIEISDGAIQSLCDRGQGLQSVKSKVHISDAKWHSVFVTFSADNLKVTVDGVEVVSSFNHQGELNLANHVYIGGIASRAKIHAKTIGLTSLEKDFNSVTGCIKNIYLQNKQYGLPETQVTRHVTPGCVWQYLCLSQPCQHGMNCVETHYDTYSCECLQGTCSSNNVENVEMNLDSDIVEITVVDVLEGGTVVIDTNHINFVVDYRTYRLRASGIIFRVVSPPQYGRLNVDTRRRGNDHNTFTLLDLKSNKVTYIHDGSDSGSDVVDFEIQILRQYDNLPENLDGFTFTLTFRVENVNDVPEIVLPKGNDLKIIQNTRLTVNSSLLYASDNDASTSELLYRVIYLTGTYNGYFEDSDVPGLAAESFTQEYVNIGRISFVNRGARPSQVKLKVSDGWSASHPLTVKFTPERIRLHITTNTGLSLFHGSAVIIQPDNLTAVSNAPPEQELDIRYTVTRLPAYGNVQRRQHASAEWENTIAFTQRHINKGRVRYFHKGTDFSITEDSLYFTVNCVGFATEEQPFSAVFHKTHLSLLINSELVLDGERSMSLTPGQLLTTTDNPNISPGEITYSIISPPRTGQLLVQTVDNRWNHLTINSNFTQANINSNRVKFQLHRESYIMVQDRFQFRIKVPVTSESELFVFHIKFLPSASNVKVVNNGLQGVLEGGMKVITKRELFVKKSSVDQFQFILSSHPKHGTLKLLEHKSESIVNRNVTHFTSADILNEKVIYEHDDSEHDEDAFMFVAMPIVAMEKSEEIEISEITGNFTINILLRNDHAPIRVVDRVIEIVRDGSKVITQEDLFYTDPDINFDSSNLRYTRRGIPNGEIVNTSDSSSRVYNFYQRDIEHGALTFKHNGADYGRAVIIVTDGQFYATGLLEIQAMDPYVRIVNNTGLQVFTSETSIISRVNLSIATNLNVKSENVLFILTATPRYGKLLLAGSEKQQFTLKDLITGDVEYIHGGSYHVMDYFDFAVQVQDLQTQDRFDIRIFSSHGQNPPTLLNNPVIIVHEGGSVRINRSNLAVGHEESSTNEIKYTILSQPKHGFLRLDSNDRVTSFTQADVDANLLDYIQVMPRVDSDLIVFDVSTEFYVLRDVEVNIEIIPVKIPIEVRNLTVREGGSKALLTHVLKIANRHIQHDGIDIIVVRPPSSGIIERSPQGEVPVNKFSYDDIENEFMYYTHNGAEIYRDHFTVIVKTEDLAKRSDPYTIYVEVIPINDEAPVIINNKALHVWQGASIIVTNESLLVEDNDNRPSELKYITTTPSNGFLALVMNPGITVVEFTQQDINNEQVMFVHLGDEESEFYLQVNDGVHFTPRETFRITAERLVLQLNVNEPLLVYPNTRQPITAEHLLASTNEVNQTRPIVFTVQSKPRFGELLTVTENSTFEVNSFTQREISLGAIVYEHTEPLMTWTAQDNIMLDVSTQYAGRLKYVGFHIGISYENLNADNRDQLIRITTVQVQEGGTVDITTSNLDASVLQEKLGHIRENEIKFVLKSLPEHGYLMIRGRNASVGDLFSSSDLQQRTVAYYHDHSDTLWDLFNFTLKLGPMQLSSGKFLSSFNITILPINDQPFILETRVPHLQVIQGFTANITSDILLTSDPDSPPENITYTIVNGPNNGRIAFSEESNIIIQSFTQADVNGNRVHFVQDGSSQSGTFQFKVTDGEFPPYYKVFHINVLPLTVELVNVTVLGIIQGHSSVTLTNQQLGAITNGHRSDILFNITSGPQFGSIFIQDSPVLQFSQEQADRNELLYVQTDFSAMKDNFTFVVYNGGASVEGSIGMTVEPFVVSRKTFNATFGQSLAISTEHLDASALAAMSQSDPKYDVTLSPRNGRLLKLQRTKRETDGANTLREFYHSDIVDGSLFYEANTLTYAGEVLDSFSYILTADGVQAAEGLFPIALQLPRLSTKKTRQPVSTQHMETSTRLFVSMVTSREPIQGVTEKNSNSGNTLEGNLDEPTDAIDDDKMLVIILISAGLVCMVIIIAVVIVCRRHKKSHSRELTNTSASNQYSEVSLNQPVTYLTQQGVVVSSSPVVQKSLNKSAQKPRSPDSCRTEISAAVPQCKVTPLYNTSPGTQDGASYQDPDETLTKTPVGSYKSNTSQYLTDDMDLDPELIEHCRKVSVGSPVLQKDQYWV